MQLPVFDIITEAISDTWANRRDLATFAFLPVLAVSIVSTVVTIFVGSPQVILTDQTLTPPQITAPQMFGFMLVMLVAFVFYTLFAVAWHRRTLVGPEPATVGVAMHWGGRQWRFFRQIVSLMVRLFALLILLTAVLSFTLRGAAPAIPLVSAMLIAIGLIYARLALVLPAAATDSPMTFAQSMRLTRGNSWRMLIAIVVLPLGVMLAGRIVVSLIAALVGTTIGTSVTALFVYSLLIAAASYFGFAIGITALSLAYRQLTE